MTTGRINQVTISNTSDRVNVSLAPEGEFVTQEDYYLTSRSVPLSQRRLIRKLIVPGFPHTRPYHIHLDRSQESVADKKTSHRPIKYRAAPPNDSGFMFKHN